MWRRDSDSPANGAGHLTTLAEKERENKLDRERQSERTCDSMRFTAALRRFIAPSKHKMCPVGKRAHAWVHPHFTFTADCRLNRPTFPDFLLRRTRSGSHPPILFFLPLYLLCLVCRLTYRDFVLSTLVICLRAQPRATVPLDFMFLFSSIVLLMVPTANLY